MRSLCLLPAFGLALVMGCRADAGFSALILPLEDETSLSQASRTWVLSGPECDAKAEPGAGHVVYRLPNKHVYRMEARAGTKATDVSRSLDRFGPGTDGFISTSGDGEWMLVQTSRFGCGAESCMVRVNRTMCMVQTIVSNGGLVRPAATAAIASGGRTIVYPSGDGPHEQDLFAVTQDAGGWSAPVLLTADSRFAYNAQPTISADGLHALFDCGNESGAGEGTSICEVKTDGKDMTIRVASKDGPGGKSANHHASYSPDGSIVFEGSWYGGAEQVWRAFPGKAPALINDEVVEVNPVVYRFTDDNSPCVLPDGRILSLWLGRPTENGKEIGHELKSMDPQGGTARMVLTGVDVVDTGMSCSL